MALTAATRFLAVASLSVPAHCAAADDTQRQRALSVAGVQKVINMLTDMLATAKQEKNEEEVAFAKFSTWCKHEATDLQADIQRNAEAIEMHTTEIAKLESEIAELAGDIAKLNDGIASNKGELKAETEQRERGHADFLAEEQDYSESVDAIARAITTLSEQSYDRPATAAALLQVSAREEMPQQLKSMITAFLSMKDEPMNYQAPEANAYEFQSSGIVDMLKNLQDDFRGKLSECQKGEMNSQHAHNMVKQDLTDSIENAKKDSEEKSALKDRKTENAAENKKQLASTSDMKAANEKTLADTQTECSEKDMSFQEKQNLRTEEIEAIGKAIEILSSPEVSGNAEKYLELVQVGRAKSLAFLQAAEGRAATGVEGIRTKVRRFLFAEGGRLKSKNLALLSQKLIADPFAKVKGLIDGMITRLLEEANADSVHEGWCDTEMGKSQIARTKMTEDIDALEAEIEDGKSTILSLQESTKVITQEVSDLMASMSEATDLKKQETATNKQTIQDAKAAQAAVQAATAVIKDFYAKAMTATALLQGRGAAAGMQGRAAAAQTQWGLKQTVKMGSEEWNALANSNFDGSVDTGHKAGMQTFGDATQGQQDESEFGVVPMLELIHSDFANLEADTSAAEAASMQAYNAFMIESKKNKAVKDRKVEMNNADKAAAEAKLQADVTDMKATQDQLLAADRYHAILVPKCIDKGQTYEERTAAREAEIASLKQALTILKSEDIETSA